MGLDLLLKREKIGEGGSSFIQHWSHDSLLDEFIGEANIILTYNRGYVSHYITL